jgi:hypothetical protein
LGHFPFLPANSGGTAKWYWQDAHVTGIDMTSPQPDQRLNKSNACPNSPHLRF